MGIWLQKSASIQKRTTPLKFDNFAEKSEKDTVSYLSSKWVGAGAITFIGSQIVHLPLNWKLGQIGLIPSATPISFQTAALLGLTAGLCEELARAAALTWCVAEVRA